MTQLAVVRYREEVVALGATEHYALAVETSHHLEATLLSDHSALVVVLPALSAPDLLIALAENAVRPGALL